jgi:hypothetical protein
MMSKSSWNATGTARMNSDGPQLPPRQSDQDATIAKERSGVNKRVQRGAAQHREPLPCANCGKDLLETRFGVLVLVGLRGCWPREFVRAYWACKGPCDVAVGAAFDTNA